MEKYFKKPAKILENEKTKKIWDINESKGFVNCKGYKIRKDLPNKEQVCYYLYLIDIYIKELGGFILQNLKEANKKKCYNEMLIFLHTPYMIQELPKSAYYNGLNKPKKIMEKKKNCPIKTLLDNNYLASYRLIMLRIREENGKIIKWKGKEGIKSLVLHELTHTCCNHVTYREEGNHLKQDFEKCEKFLINMANKNENCKNIEKILTNF